MTLDAPINPTFASAKKVPKKGKKMSEREHVVHRPDMFIGSCEMLDCDVWSMEEVTFEDEDGNETKKPEKHIVKKIFENYNPGFGRIHTEIFSNIIDNKWESEKMGVKMTTVKISVSEDTCTTENDGRWIPVEKQEFEDVDPVTKKNITRMAYPVEVFFTELRSGTNYDDEEDRKTSGRNGIGAKATTFFSTDMEVTCFDPINHKKITLTSRNNGADISLDEPSKYIGKTGKTIIKFKPDFAKFGITPPSFSQEIDEPTRSGTSDEPTRSGTGGYSQDWVDYFRKQSYDISMVTGLKVYFNSELVNIRNMKQYAQAVIGKTAHMIEISAQDCDVILAERDATFGENKIAHISFVNGIYTKNGGTHVQSWKEKLLGQVRDVLNKNIKIPKGIEDKKIPKFSIDYFANNFIIFVRCEVDNPKFDSQTKDELISPKISLIKQDGKLTEKDLASIMKWNFVAAANDRWQHELDKVYTKAGNEPAKHLDAKVRMANWANTLKRDKTFFYLTEGDSAKTLIEAGCSFMTDGCNINGSFPIRGKMPNAMKKSGNIISLNKEIKAIKAALNLRQNIDYADPANLKTLSHGGLRLGTDSDADGTHIAALILALLYALYNTLFKSGYVSIHMFPKASKIIKGKKVFFYRDADYAGMTGIKHYKGLGTFRNEDAEDFFNNPKILTLVPTDEDKKWMNMALGNGESDQRKTWISNYIDKKLDGYMFEEIYEGTLEIPKFIKENLTAFFCEALYRAIPSMVDGLKEGQRKCIYSMQKRNIYMNKPCTMGSKKVVMLQGVTLEEGEYHHGDTALGGTFVNLATGYVGSNNIPWCFNDGQFGTRHGDKAAATRYIDTALDPIIKLILNPLDLPICKYKKGEQKMIEPEWYPTLLPMLLVNGAAGIAVGFASDTPCFNPLDIVKAIRIFLRDSEEEEIKYPSILPWYRGYTGEIEPFKNTWRSTGTIKKTAIGTYEITELPLSGKYSKTQSYKDFLWTWKKGKKFVKKINEYHAINSVKFEIITDKKEDENDFSESKMHLTANLKFNMWVVDEEGRPKYYNNINTYIDDWCLHRITVYKQRKRYWLARLKFEKEVSEEKARYIKQILEEEIIPKGKSVKKLTEIVEENKYRKCSMKMCKWQPPPSRKEAEEEDEEEESDDEEEKGFSFGYIFNMRILNLTDDEIEKLNKEVEQKKEEYLTLKNKTVQDIWGEELDAFEEMYPKFIEIRNKSDGKKRSLAKKGKK